MSLSREAEEWADYVVEKRDYDRKDMTEAVRGAGFDVQDQVKALEQIYLCSRTEEPWERRK